MLACCRVCQGCCILARSIFSFLFFVFFFFWLYSLEQRRCSQQMVHGLKQNSMEKWISHDIHVRVWAGVWCGESRFGQFSFLSEKINQEQCALMTKWDLKLVVWPLARHVLVHARRSRGEVTWLIWDHISSSGHVIPVRFSRWGKRTDRKDFHHTTNQLKPFHTWAASRENRPNAGCDNVEISWVKVRPLCTGPMYCVTSNCHNSVVSQDFLILFSTTCNLAEREDFYGKISKSNFLA